MSIILIIPGVPIDDEQQIAFSNQWGPLEPTKGVNLASGTVFARSQTWTVMTADIPPDDRRMDYQKGNYQWHADSTFKVRRRCAPFCPRAKSHQAAGIQNSFQRGPLTNV